MLNGTIQFVLDLLIAGVSLTLVAALLVAVVIMAAVATSRLAMRAEAGDFDEPSD